MCTSNSPLNLLQTFADFPSIGSSLQSIYPSSSPLPASLSLVQLSVPILVRLLDGTSAYFQLPVHSNTFSCTNRKKEEKLKRAETSPYLVSCTSSDASSLCPPPSASTELISTRCYLSLSTLAEAIEDRYCIPKLIQRFIHNCHYFTSNDFLLISKSTELLSFSFPLYFSLHLSLLGGKGGFGSLLRTATSAVGTKKTDNFSAMRDLSGRRLRHVEQEKELKEWEAKQSKMTEEEKKKETKERELRLRAINTGKRAKLRDCKWGYDCKYRDTCRNRHPDEYESDGEFIDDKKKKSERRRKNKLKRRFGDDEEEVEEEKEKIFLTEEMKKETENIIAANTQQEIKKSHKKYKKEQIEGGDYQNINSHHSQHINNIYNTTVSHPTTATTTTLSQNYGAKTNSTMEITTSVSNSASLMTIAGLDYFDDEEGEEEGNDDDTEDKDDVEKKEPEFFDEEKNSNHLPLLSGSISEPAGDIGTGMTQLSSSPNSNLVKGVHINNHETFEEQLNPSSPLLQLVV